MSRLTATVLLGTVTGALIGCAHTRPEVVPVAAREPAPVVTHKPPPVPVVPPVRRASRQRPVAGLPTVLLRIRSCESGPNGYATHGWAFDYDYAEDDNASSSASGGWQFIDSTFRAVTGLPGRAVDYPRAVQDSAALKLYREQGSAPWLASASCWAA